MKQDCIIIGAGTYGQVYAEYLKDSYTVLGFYDDNPEIIGQEINGVKVVDKVEEAFNLKKEIAVFVPIGNNAVRVELLKEFEDKGFYIPSFIHPQAIVHSSVLLGKAVYILPGTNIMPLTSIGDYCMMSVNTVVSHHTILEQGVFLSFGVNIGASMVLEKYTYVGIGATIMTGVKSVGEKSLIGAGAVIIRDVPDGATVVGNPGRVLPSSSK